MNNWDEVKKMAIVEADDFQDRYDRNGLNFLFYWKTKYPNFKITLFTIPDRTSPELLKLLYWHREWIEIAIHGWNHESNFECYGWSYEKTKALMERADKYQDDVELGFRHYKKIFKAPGWTITHGLNGYPVHGDIYKDGKLESASNLNGSNKAIFEDPQGVYRALIDMDFIIFDRHYNKPARPDGLKIVCVDCNPDIVHMHTWDMETGDKAGQNGFRQVEEEHGVPWNRDTEFHFISEAFEKGLFKPCQG